MWVTCECGREFGSEENSTNYHPSDWYGLLEFEGKTYVEYCGCWRDRAEKLTQWIDGHKHEIAKYLQLEKIRLTNIANDHPVVDSLEFSRGK